MTNDNEELAAITIAPLQRVISGELVLDPSQDWEALYNMREWLTKAVEAKGAKVIGGGCGCDSADISIELEDCSYNISISAVVRGMIDGK